ncbi:MAG: hypothetical protein JST21_06470 [Bacteroidetes bacterium]|nr:hypothetical protein [Bacteroidota bacterium]
MKAAWTIMLYMNVEPEGFDTGFRKNQWEMLLTGSTEKMQIIALVDRNPPSKERKPMKKEYLLPSIYRIEKGVEINLSTKPLHIIKDDDIGKHEVLEQFLKYCIDNFPAEKYMLSFWDHGLGNGVTTSPDKVDKKEIQELIQRKNLSVLGRRHLNAINQQTFTRTPVGSTFHLAAAASTRFIYSNRKITHFSTNQPDTKQDYLYTKEISTAIKKIFGKENKIDIIAFDACWMQTFENAYALRDVAKYLVASENLISLQGFGYYLFFKNLAATPDADPAAVAALLIKSSYLKVSDTLEAKTPDELVKLYYTKIYDDNKMTLTCIDLSFTKLVADKIDALARMMEKELSNLFDNIRIARFLCLSFFDEEDPADYDLKVIDLVYFLKKLSENLLTALHSKDKSEPDIYTPIINLCNEIADMAEMYFVIYKEMGPAMREEKEADKRWGTHGFSIFFPEHYFEWKQYKDSEGWYFETQKGIQMPFAVENYWKVFLKKYFAMLNKKV